MRSRDENKEQLIRQKTIELVVKEGLDGFSMQKLAKAAKVSPATLYIYYKDREDLILKICKEASDRILAKSMDGFSPEMPFAEGLKKQWYNRAAHYMENPLDVQFVEQIKYTQLYDKIKETLSRDFREIMTRFVMNARANKELMILPFEVYWSIAFAPLYQLIKFHSHGRSHANENFTLTNELMDATLELVLKALKP